MPKYSERDNALVIEVDGGVGDEIQFTKLADGGMDIEVNEPWAGSTETGFGATASVQLSAADVERLRKWFNS